MAVPATAQPTAEASHEAVFRPARSPDGARIIQQLPLTREVLLDPREDDQVTQSRPHQRQLGPLADTLARFLERRDGVAVGSDLLIRWKQLGERDVSPDLCVISGVRDPDAIEDGFDPVVEGAGPCLIFEVVSESTRDVRLKDEEDNPPLSERMGVEDLVLVYPWRPVQQRRLRIEARHLDAGDGRYRPNRPGPSGWVLLASVGLRIKVAEDGKRLLVEDAYTGERLLTSVEEEAARRAAERRAGAAEQAREQAELERERAELERKRAQQERDALLLARRDAITRLSEKGMDRAEIALVLGIDVESVASDLDANRQ